MIGTLQSPYREPDSNTGKWVLIFVLASLLAHALILLIVLFITRVMPVPKFVPKPDDAKMTLSLLPEPAPAAKPKPVFVPTRPQDNVTPKEQPNISANDTVVQSRAKIATDPASLMPELSGKPHAPDMRDSPLVTAPPAPQVASTPPVPKTVQPPTQSPPTPKPQMAQQITPRPLPPAPHPTPPKPQPRAQPAVDPETGLPVLPPISAATLAPPDQSHPLAPAPSPQQQEGISHGALGRAGDNSPAAMATEAGRYKQYVYEVVGSYWYPAINEHFGTIGVGAVHIRFTIHSDGTLSDVTILDGENLTQLKTISKNALVSPAPFKKFSDGMIKEVGDSYTDDFSFSVY